MDLIESPDDPPSKRAILSAALALFAERGVHATNVRAIGEAAGYTNPALFKFFPTKDALAVHLFERCYLALSLHLRNAYDPKRPFRQNLHHLLESQHEFVDRHPDAYFFLQDHVRELWPKVSRTVRRQSTARVLRGLLEQGVAEGAVDARVNRDLLVATLTGAFQQYARTRHLGGLRGPSSELRAALEDLMLRMISPRHREEPKHAR